MFPVRVASFTAAVFAAAVTLPGPWAGLENNSDSACACCWDQGTSTDPEHIFDTGYDCEEEGCEDPYDCMKGNQKNGAPEGGPPRYHPDTVMEWFCADAHLACGASELSVDDRSSIELMLNASDYAKAASRIANSKGESMLNVSRSMVQFLDCKGRVTGQLVVDGARLRLLLDALQKPAIGVGITRHFTAQLTR